MLQSIKFALSASPICFANAAIAARLLSGGRTKREVVPLRQINHKAGNFACSHSPDCPFSLAATAKTQAARASLFCVLREIYVQFLCERPFFATRKAAFCPNSEAKCC